MNPVFVVFACSAVLCAIVFKIAVASSRNDEDEAKTKLYFSYMASMSGSFLSSGAIPAVELALEQINNRSDLLTNYTLAYTTVLDSKVSI